LVEIVFEKWEILIFAFDFFDFFKWKKKVKNNLKLDFLSFIKNLMIKEKKLFR